MLIKLEINRKNIEKNLLKIKNINKNIICVLKDEAYGLGIDNVLPILIENECHHFAVAYKEEALKIKKIIQEKYSEKKEKINIITLNYIENDDLIEMINNDIELTIFGLEQLEGYINILNTNEVNRKIKFHIKLNTGMNRLGFNENELQLLCTKIQKLQQNKKNIEIISIFSHISNSEDVIGTENQIEKFEKMLNEIKKLKIEYKYTHIQASPLLFKYNEKYNYNFARIGMAIYGMEPLYEKMGLEQTITLKSTIINMRNVKKGEKVSYGDTGIVENDKLIAIVPIGYAHGLPKQIEKSNPYVLINGKRAYMLGEVCMDMIIVDVTNIDNLSIGDEVIIIGKQKKEEITLLDMANWANTIQDDILTNWNKLIKRIVK